MVILAIILFIGAVALLPLRPLFSPALSFLGLLSMSFAKSGGYQLLPINGVMLTSWLCMTLIVTLVTLLQPAAVRNQSRGMGYIIGGALVGLAVGLLGFTLSSNISLIYGIMIVAVVAGIFLGFLLYTNTPHGRPVGLRSGNFFHYLLAKGFPVAITLIQPGLAICLLLVLHN